MKARKRKNTKSLRNSILVFSLCAIVLSVSTYAWFIGMTKVNVSSFEVEIKSTEGLYLSMDGTNWSYTLDPKNAPAYADNTNNWLDAAGEGLSPVSTVGEMDKTTSRMKLYEKGSLTSTAGGYRLLSTQVDNFSSDGAGGLVEGEGYVAFDLFIKNLSGEEYYVENNVLNEEAIYLNVDSSVIVDTAGAGVENTGIENSVRVAFAQIGRVEADTTDADQITAITCADVAADAGTGQVQVTGVCRDAQIWEPNDTNHNANAISYYDTACRARTGSDVNADASYERGTTCTAVTDGDANTTYAISRTIDIADNVDVYDGADYNTYTANSSTYDAFAAADATARAAMKLVEAPAFTDSMKDIAGMDRPEFMTLAPNSITKVRVYVYIEGQDIDNYDFAQLGTQVSVNFGFTKQKFETSDIPGYSGPSLDYGTDTTPNPNNP